MTLRNFWTSLFDLFVISFFFEGLDFALETIIILQRSSVQSPRPAVNLISFLSHFRLYLRQKLEPFLSGMHNLMQTLAWLISKEISRRLDKTQTPLVPSLTSSLIPRKIHQKINLKKRKVDSDHIISRMAEDDSCPLSERSLSRSCMVKVVGSMSILDPCNYFTTQHKKQSR